MPNLSRKERLLKELKKLKRLLSFAYEDSTGSACCDSWLLCQPFEDRLQIIREGLLEMKSDVQGWQRYSQQITDPNSRIQKNFRKDACKLVKQFRTSSGDRTLSEERFPFTPQKDAMLGGFMRILARKIRGGELSVAHDRLARQLLKYLEFCLFDNTKFSTKQRVHFLRTQGFSRRRIQNWGDQEFRMNLRRSAYNIDEQRASLTIRRIVDKCISTHSWTSLQVAIYCWVAQTTAKQNASVDVAEILNLSLSKISSCSKTGPSPTLSRRINFGGTMVSLSPTLLRMLRLLGDKRRPDEAIFSIDRSTLEDHLRRINCDLGYDFTQDPLTPETFLRCPHGCVGHRTSPTWQRIANRAHHVSRDIFFKISKKNFSSGFSKLYSERCIAIVLSCKTS